ncbi:MAG: MarR family winged helix-turn-helix transcriptional regulator [Campylobacterota bacterium]
MKCNDMDIKFLLLNKLSIIEDLSLEQAKQYGYEDKDIISSSKILAFVDNGVVTISSIAKKIGISRQAVHKVVKNLADKGFLILAHEMNKRDKQIQMTQKGQELLVCRQEVMQKVEDRIAQNIGEEEFCKLKKLLQMSWD